MKARNGTQKAMQMVLMVTLMSVSQYGAAAAEQAGKDWYAALRLGFQPYTIDVSGTARNRDFDAKADLSDILDETDTTIMGGELEFGKGQWFTTLAFFNQKSKAERGDTTRGTEVTFKETGFNPLLGYRAYRQSLGGGRALSLDALVGIYYVKVSTDVDIYSPSGNVSHSEDLTLTDMMVGARLNYAFTKRFGAGVFGEIGGGGSKLQYVAAANLAYAFTDWFAVSGGYKYWYFKYEDSGETLSTLEQKLYGPVLGVQFKY